MARIGIMVCWVVGGFFTLAGGINLVTGGGLAAAILMLAGVVLLPPIRELGNRFLPSGVPWWAPAVLAVILLVVAQAAEMSSEDPARPTARRSTQGGISAKTVQKAATRKTGPAPAPRQMLRVSAPDIYNTYTANELAADDTYKNKRIIVQGRVDAITEDWGSPTVRLDAGPGHYVLCRFEKEQRPSLTSLAVGEEVSMEGTCQGMTLTFLAFSDCRPAR